MSLIYININMKKLKHIVKLYMKKLKTYIYMKKMITLKKLHVKLTINDLIF